VGRVVVFYVLGRGMDRRMSTGLILCAGSGSRWANHLGRPKQLLRIGDETLLERMVRQFRGAGLTDLHVVARNKEFRLPGCGFLNPGATRYTVQTLLATRELWSRRTIVLLGDVWYSNRAVKRIMACQVPLAFFGREHPSIITGCTWGELFALSFSAEAADELTQHIAVATDDALHGGRGRLWQLYRSLAGLPLDSEAVERRIFHRINDLTDDFDVPADWTMWRRRHRLATSASPTVRLLFALWGHLPPRLGWAIMRRARRARLSIGRARLKPQKAGNA
jgi:hypothetical protein